MGFILYFFIIHVCIYTTFMSGVIRDPRRLGFTPNWWLNMVVMLETRREFGGLECDCTLLLRQAYMWHDWHPYKETLKP